MRGRNLTQPVHITDIYATFCHLAGVDARDGHNAVGVFPVDSVDLWPLLSGQNLSAPRDMLVLGHDFVYGKNKTTMGAVISQGWKLIIGRQGYADYRGRLFPCVAATPAPNCEPYCVYNLAVDPLETTDLSADPATVRQLRRLRALYEQEVNLPQNEDTDQSGFEAAVARRGGYMGPWLDDSPSGTPVL